jgi:hypothetical protein
MGQHSGVSRYRIQQEMTSADHEKEDALAHIKTLATQVF